jgi:4-amino-4-deoxy-L-arabinose transferase-like glycosyltransferase
VITSVGDNRGVTSTTPATVLPTPQSRRRRRWGALAVVALLGGTALLYLYNLGASGWANSFYAAAVQAGTQNWKAFLFGSSDAANSITVDKTPAALWVMGLSARVFGLNAWSLLVPQALEGVAAVGVLYAAVRRVAGPPAGLVAGGVLALTPAATLMFRYNNPDALLVLLLVVATYCVLRALEAGSAGWWLPLAGVVMGLAFLAKMLQAFLVLPVFAIVYLVAADAPLRVRARRLLGGAGALLVCASWYLLLVELWPASSRPYIGGSQHNSILELALGYNGLGRLNGNETGGLGNPNFDAGTGRLFGPQMGGQIAWLLPAAAIATVAGLWITRRGPHTDPVRAALLLWGGSLLGTGAVLSYAVGIVHPYYTVALAPATAASLAIGSSLLWRRRNDIRAAATLAAMVTITAILGYVLLERVPSWLPWLRWLILVGGVAVAALTLLVGRLGPRHAYALATAALAVSLAGPAAYSLATVATSHRGAIPSAGPRGQFRHFDGPRKPAPGPGGPSFWSVEASPAVTATLRADAEHYTWAAAAIGSNNAAGYQLATGAPVMAVGGYNGTDPSPTLAQFKAYAAQHRIHFFVSGSVKRRRGGAQSGSDDAEQISRWVAATYPPQKVGGVTIYNLSQ